MLLGLLPPAQHTWVAWADKVMYRVIPAWELMQGSYKAEMGCFCNDCASARRNVGSASSVGLSRRPHAGQAIWAVLMTDILGLDQTSAAGPPAQSAAGCHPHHCICLVTHPFGAACMP